MSVPDLHWSIRPFQELTPIEVHDVMRLRVDVFVIEQRCVYPEIDGRDPSAWHVRGVDQQGRLMAYARILPPENAGAPHIGRVIVHPSLRGRHVGRHLMHRSLRAVEALFGGVRCELAAQAYLVPFYTSFGFMPTSDAYDWDGIPHVDMVRGERFPP